MYFQTSLLSVWLRQVYLGTDYKQMRPFLLQNTIISPSGFSKLRPACHKQDVANCFVCAGTIACLQLSLLHSLASHRIKFLSPFYLSVAYSCLLACWLLTVMLLDTGNLLLPTYWASNVLLWFKNQLKSVCLCDLDGVVHWTCSCLN